MNNKIHAVLELDAFGDNEWSKGDGADYFNQLNWLGLAYHIEDQVDDIVWSGAGPDDETLAVMKKIAASMPDWACEEYLEAGCAAIEA